MAERGGFEPPVPLLGVHTISSRAPSTARSPLRFTISTVYRVHLVRSICRCLQNLSKGVGCGLGFQTYHGLRRITKLGEAIVPTLCREFLASHRTEFSKQTDNIR